MDKQTALLQFSQEVAKAIADCKKAEHRGVRKVEHEYRPVKNMEYRDGNELYYQPNRNNYQRYFSYIVSVRILWV